MTMLTVYVRRLRPISSFYLKRYKTLSGVEAPLQLNEQLRIDKGSPGDALHILT